MYCHVLRDCSGAVLALEIVDAPTRAAYGRFTPTAERVPLDVDVEPSLLKLLKVRQSDVRSNLRIAIEDGKATLVSADQTSV